MGPLQGERMRMLLEGVRFGHDRQVGVSRDTVWKFGVAEKGWRIVGITVRAVLFVLVSTAL
jgi:hypothetical protein